MHGRHSRRYSAKNVAIVERRQIARQPALDANLGRAEFPRLDGFVGHLLGSEEICIGFPRAAAKGTELATYETDVREIDVAIDDVGDDVSDQFAAKRVSSNEQAQEIIARTVGQQKTFVVREHMAVLGFENGFERTADVW